MKLSGERIDELINLILMERDIKPRMEQACKETALAIADELDLQSKEATLSTADIMQRCAIKIRKEYE